MRRLVGPVLGLLLGGIPVFATAAERSGEAPPITLWEARPNPILPAALIPFSIAPEVCRNGHVPRVTLKVYDGVAKQVATLSLRGRLEVLLDGAPLRCGDYVAKWDGTVTVNGKRTVGLQAVYMLRLEVDELQPQVKRVIVP